MTKRELITELVKKTGCSKREVTDVVDGLIKTVVVTMASGEAIYLQGLGTFRPKYKCPRRAGSLTGGDPYEIPECYAPDLKFDKSVRDMVKEGNR